MCRKGKNRNPAAQNVFLSCLLHLNEIRIRGKNSQCLTQDGCVCVCVCVRVCGGSRTTPRPVRGTSPNAARARPTPSRVKGAGGGGGCRLGVSLGSSISQCSSKIDVSGLRRSLRTPSRGGGQGAQRRKNVTGGRIKCVCVRACVCVCVYSLLGGLPPRRELHVTAHKFCACTVFVCVCVCVCLCVCVCISP